MADLRTAAARYPGDARLRRLVGELELDCDALQIPGDDQVLVVFSATPGGPDAEALALLRVLGTPAARVRAAGR